MQKKPKYAVETLLRVLAAATLGLIAPSLFLWGQENWPLPASEFDFWIGQCGESELVRVVGKIVYGILIGGFSLAWIKLYQKREQIEKYPLASLYGSALLMILGATAMVPWLSIDLYYYLSLGWVDAHYQVSPYTVPIHQLEGYTLDPMFTWMKQLWGGIGAPYGPLFIKSMAWISGASYGNPKVALIYYKIVNTVIHLVCGGILWLWLKKIKEKEYHSKTFLFLINPVSFFCVLGNGHNDAWMMLPLLAAWMMAWSERRLLAVILFAASVAVKYTSLLAAPVLILFLTQRDQGWKKWGMMALWSSLLLGAALGLHGIYDDPWSSIQHVFSGGYFESRNPVILVSELILQRCGVGETLLWAKGITHGIFILGVAALSWKWAIQKAAWTLSEIAERSATLWIFYFMIPNLKFHEWYLVWMISLLPLMKESRLHRILLAATFLSTFGSAFLQRGPLFVALTMVALINSLFWVLFYWDYCRSKSRA